MSVEHAPDTVAVAGKVASAATYVGSGTAFVSGAAKVFGFTQAEWAVIGVIGGLLVAVGGFVVNWIYRHKHYRLAVKRAGMESRPGDLE